MSDFAYFSKMFQAVPQLMEVQKHAGGTFVSSRKSTLDAARKLYPDVPMRKYNTWFRKLSAGYKVLDDAGVILTGSPGGKLLSEFAARRCMVFHGTFMLLSKDTLKSMGHFDLLCTVGPRMQRTVELYQDELKLNAMETGYLPFGSFPEKSAIATTASLERLGLSPEKKTLVYMPWGKPYGSWSLMAELIARETPKEFNLILRPHPSQGLTSRRKDRDSFKRIAAICKERGDTLLDINACPLSLLFSIADLMITDGTSPAEESLFYDVPQLFIETPLWSIDEISAFARRNAVSERELAEFLELFECGKTYRLGGSEPLSARIYEALGAAASLQSKRESYFRWVFGDRDRNAGELVYQAARSLISE